MTADTHERPTGWTPATPAISAESLAKQCPPWEPYGDARGGGRRFTTARCLRVWAQREDGGWIACIEVEVPGAGDTYVHRSTIGFGSWESALKWAVRSWDCEIE